MLLIERGADVNRAADSDGNAPLFATLQTQWAGYNSEQPQPRAQELQTAQYMDVLNALLAKGADPNARLKTHIYYLVWAGQLGLDITGATPFWRAAYAQDLEAMKALVAAGADPYIPTRWPEIGMRTARQQDGRIMDDSGIPRAEGAANMYPLHAAAGGGYLGLASWTVQNVPNNFLATVKWLVEEQGYDVNLRDSWGYTPLHYAAVRGGNDLIEYLVSKGADVAATTLLGQTPIDMARGGRAGYFERVPFPATVELLQRLGSPAKCLSTTFRGTGDLCAEFQGVPFKGLTLDENAPQPTI
jgi:ankyrin repeat protein